MQHPSGAGPHASPSDAEGHARAAVNPGPQASEPRPEALASIRSRGVPGSHRKVSRRRRPAVGGRHPFRLVRPRTRWRALMTFLAARTAAVGTPSRPSPADVESPRSSVMRGHPEDEDRSVRSRSLAPETHPFAGAKSGRERFCARQGPIPYLIGRDSALASEESAPRSVRLLHGLASSRCEEIRMRPETARPRERAPGAFGFGSATPSPTERSQQ